MFITSSFTEWLDENAVNGNISVEKLKEYLSSQTIESMLPISKNSELAFIDPNSFDSPWENIDSVFSYFVLSSTSSKKYIDSLFEKNIDDTQGNSYLVEDLFFTDDVQYLLVKKTG